MELLHSLSLDPLEPCPYLPGRQKRYEYFLAAALSEEDISTLLTSGWRKFGLYFFRPRCPDCDLCIPLRINTAEFTPSRSQRRTLRNNTDLDVSFGPLHFHPRIFEIYRYHSLARFGRQSELGDFLSSFYTPSCPAVQLEIRLGELLIGIGFLDIGQDATSSVYFCFDPAFSKRGLGTFSILKEIEYARSIGATRHYLGFFVPGCSVMAYKDRFLPREHRDGRTGRWEAAP